MKGLINKIFGKKQENGKIKESQILMEFEEFLKFSKDKLEKMYPGSKAEERIDPRVSKLPCLNLKYKGEEETFGLYYAYQKYLKSPGSLNNILEMQFNGFREYGALDFKNFDSLKMKIFPQIKSEEFVNNLSVKVANSKLIGDLTKIYVIDLPNNVAFISEDSLRKWGKTVDEIDAIAIKNLENKPEKEIVFYCIKSKVEDRVVMCHINGNEYTASLILCPKRLLAFAKQQGMKCDALIVGVPSREEMMLSEPNPKIDLFKKIFSSYYNEAVYKVTNKVFELTDKGIKEMF